MRRRQTGGGVAFRLSAVCGAVLLAVIFACGGEKSPELVLTHRPLLDSPLAAEVLVEAARLDPPPSQSGSRLLTGWTSERVGGRIRWKPDPEGAGIEIVNIGNRPRRLEFGDSEQQRDSIVEVTLGDRVLGRFELGAESGITLPEDLPVGRVPLELRFDPPVAVKPPVIRPVAPGGMVEISGDTITQPPWSVVEIVRRVGPGSRLMGSFVPPDEPERNQRFEIVIDGGSPNGEETGPRWRWNASATPDAEIDLPLPEGLARIQLRALGRGGAGVWRGLSIADVADSAPARVNPPKPPQLVVLYVLDALRADHVGGRGFSPVLDQMAAEGVGFTDFAAVAPSTMTSTKALFSGRFFLDRGGLPTDIETLAEVMRSAGYRTLGVSGNGHVSDRYGLTRGFDEFEMVYPLARGADPETFVNRNAADIHRRGLELLDGASPEAPAFLYLHTVHPHTPYAPPHDTAREMCGEIDSSINGMSPTLLSIRDDEVELSDADRDRLRCLYAASVAYNDARIGELTAALAERYPRDEILFIVTSDHGEEFFDHGGVLHGHSLYDELLQVPLILHWPGRLDPSVVDLPIDTFDLHETLRTLVGAPASSGDPEGRSLWGVIFGGDEGRVDRRLRFAAVPTLPGGIFMARSEDHKLVWAPRTGHEWGMGLGLGRSYDPEYFFDLGVDPRETTNLVGGGTIEENWLRSRLRVWIERYSFRGEIQEVELDDETRQHLEALGYVE